MNDLDADVIIVGSGPVGMTLAIDLAKRGVSVLVAERNPAGGAPMTRCNHISSRSMEIFRQLGFASEIRAAGLPGWHPHDIAFTTSMTGYELGRIKIPGRDERARGGDFLDSDWPTVEPLQRCNQMFFEPIMRRHLEAEPNITVVYSVEVDSVEEDEERASVTGHDVDTGEARRFSARFVVGCEGGSSLVRKAMGATFVGDPVISKNRSLIIRAPDLAQSDNLICSWLSMVINPRIKGYGSTCALNGVDMWLVMFSLPANGPDFEDMSTFDLDAALFNLVGRPFDYEVVTINDWSGRRLIADKFREGRLFICGDSAHIWAPYAGYGMNAGVASAQTLAWQLAGVIKGWGGPLLLDAYQAERLPVTEQVSNHAKLLNLRNLQAQVIHSPAELEEASPRGEALRAIGGAEMVDINTGQFLSKGLNYGAHYNDSPIICYDGEGAPYYDLVTYTPSTVPGCRTPHVIVDGVSLYDLAGSDFALIRTDPNVDVSPLLAAAAAREIAFSQVDIDRQAGGGVYDRTLVLSRPDQHVAWRGNELPGDVEALLDKITGHAVGGTGTGLQ